MARVLANHCGYQPVEINASDERTGDQILNKIKSAISSDDHFTQKVTRPGQIEREGSGKPVCLIVDEVDGALGSSFEGSNSRGISKIVDYLKKCISYMPKSTKRGATEEDDEDEPMEDLENDEENEEIKLANKKKKKDTDVVPMRRPIIFICNDMYARALAPLREIALTIKI